MENKFFTDDLPGDNQQTPKNNKNSNLNIYEIILAIVGVLVLGFAIFQLLKSDFFKKDPVDENNNHAQSNHGFEEKPTEETDPSLIIPSEIKEILDEYCSFVDLDGRYYSPKMVSAKENIYEMCESNVCLTTVEDEEVGIIYYSKSCNSDSKKSYKKMTKEEMDLNNLYAEACNSLDDKGNFESIDVEHNTFISCNSYSCVITYNNRESRRSCVN